MRKLVWLSALIMLICCGKAADKPKVDYTKLPAYTADGSRINNTNDTIRLYNETFHEYDIIAPGDTVCDPVKEGYPDTIRVAFTRNGVFEDSLDVARVPGIEFGLKYVYMFRCAVGDAVYYTREGKFLEFACTKLPHSGQGHHNYKP